MGHQIATDDERRHRITLENSLAFPGLLFPSLYWMFIAFHCFPLTRIISKHILAHRVTAHQGIPISFVNPGVRSSAMQFPFST